MNYGDVRELVRIRHKLRSLADEREHTLAAASLLERMGVLAARDAVEHAAVLPEMQRWRSVFGLEVAGR